MSYLARHPAHQQAQHSEQQTQPARVGQVYLGFCGSPILVCAAHIDAVVAPAAAVARIHISAQHAANDVSQMRHIVDIWQGAGDQDVPFACMAHAMRRFDFPQITHWLLSIVPIHSLCAEFFSNLSAAMIHSTQWTLPGVTCVEISKVRRP